MTGDYRFRIIPGILYFMFTLLLLSGCIAENTDDCYKGTPLTVELPTDISPQTMKDISLYVFDDKDRLLDVFSMSDMEPVILNHPDIPILHCVALCNTQDGTMSVSPPEQGGARSDGFISLKPAEPTRAEQGIFTSPTDLFYGELKFENNTTHTQAEKQVITVSRMTASMNITLRGLQRLTGTEDGDYSLVVRETSSRMDFNGTYGGTPASYSPPVKLAVNKDFEVSMFRLFPTVNASGLTFEIYHNGTLLKSVHADGSGNRIIPVVGKTTNLLLNFEGSVDVEIEITGWGETVVWKEYN
ncbi:FimB/Mfa2 family fimbrial subunit [Bacteroides sp.]|uniref:FimB/Mfa2 family fimbrial subunit n=1 Tax=Bacteroides sp. TaxID=29523 RepID=UPI0025BEFCFE|nr:FimB/Mfa2 family fimbrial subunit [Bacteroides sp.]